MAGFKEIVGHEHIIEHLKNAIRLDRVSHAYIFDGPKHSGKMLLAKAFAQALLCEGNSAQTANQTNLNEGITGEACGQCRFCRQVENDNHPDIIYVSHEKPKVISVGDIREQINASVAIKPYNVESPYKIYIVDEAEKMNEQAQNALLKTIEEPPTYVVIILLTTNMDSFLQTIRSRCVALELRPVDDRRIRSLLMKKYQMTDYMAEACTAFAQGNVGKAIQLSESPAFNELKDYVLNLVRRIDTTDISDMMALAKEICAFENNDDFFDLMLLWYKDVLMFKATGPKGHFTYKDQLRQIEKQAKSCQYLGLNTIINEIGLARDRIRSNVNPEMSVELLLISIKQQFEN